MEYKNITEKRLIEIIENSLGFTYNVKKVVIDFLRNMGELGAEVDTLEWDNYKFEIESVYLILDQDTEEEIIINYYNLDIVEK